MRKKQQDSPLSLLFKDNVIAKDLINHVLNLPEVIKAEDLLEGDTQESTEENRRVSSAPGIGM